MKKRMLSFRTKAEVILVASFLICLSVVSVMSVTRTITDSSDNIETFIRNSNGGIWEATGANIQLAINDLTTGGTIWMPDGTTDISSDIALSDNIHLKGVGQSTIINSPSNLYSIQVHADNNVTISDMKLTGNISLSIQTTTAETVGNITIRDVIIDAHESSKNGLFYVWVHDNDVMNNLKFIRCEAINSRTFGFIISGGSTGRLNNVMFTNCIANDSGRYDNLNQWATGFDFAESLGYVSNLTVTGCIAEGSYESGFHFEETPVLENCVLVGCISNNNGQKTGGTFNAGYLVSGGVKLSDCYASGNSLYGYRISNDAGSVILDNCVSDNDYMGFRIYGQRNGFAYLTDCVVRNSTNFAFRMTNGRNIHVQNMVTENTGGDATFGTHVGIGGSSNPVDNSSFDFNCYEPSSSRNHVIYCVNAENITITGRIVTNQRGIYVRATHYVTIKDMYIKTSDNYGIDNVDTNHHLRIFGNVIEGATTNGLRTDGSVGTDNYIFDDIGYNYDSLRDDYIWNSNGKYWTATGANIQLAINDLTTGGTVYLPAGTLIPADEIDMANNIVIKGAGVGVTILRMNSGYSGALGVFYMNSDHNCSISDLSIDGNRRNGATSGPGVFLHGSGCKDWVLDNLQINDTDGSCVFAKNGVSNGMITHISGSGVPYPSHGLSLGDSSSAFISNITVSDCRFTNGDGALTHAVDISNAQHCTIKGILAVECMSGFKVETNCKYLTLSDIIIKDCNSTSSVESAMYLHACSWVTVDNVIIEGGADHGIHLGGCSNMIFSNILIDTVADEGLRSTDSNTHNITFTNLHIKDAATRNINLQNANDFQFNNLQIEGSGTNYGRCVNNKNFTFIGGYIRNTGNNLYPFDINGCFHISFSGMTIADNVGDGMYFSGACKNFSVINCKIINNGDKGIVIDNTAHDGYIISLNDLGGNANDNEDSGTGVSKVVANNLGNWV